MPSPPFAKALWIWPDNHSWDLHNGYALFRRAVSLPVLPKRAPLSITADQSYQLYINGQYVCRGPARGFQAHWPYDTVDVRPWLKKGRNVLAVRAHNPGFSNFQYLSQGYAGLLVAARWGKTEILSDGAWKCRRQEGVRRDTVPTSLQLFCQESIDLRVEDPSWMEEGFDDSGWAAPAEKGPWNGMPWNNLEPRGIPLLEETPWPHPVRGVGTAEGVNAPDFLSARDLGAVRFQEGLTHQPAAFATDPLEIPASGEGRFRSVLLDFGKTVVGSVGFAISGARGGEVLDTLHVETVRESPLTPDFFPGKHCRMSFCHRMVCRPGTQSHTFYHTFGFRYMVVTVRNSSVPLTIRPHLRTTLYPHKQCGLLRSSEPDLERIWEICAWTQRICSLDAYVDTPWREQAQWWGDARVQAWNTFHLSGDARLFRRGIAQIAAQTTPTGLTYGHAPTMAHSCILPDFSLIWILTLWDHYWQTGSPEAFQSHAPVAEGILNYFRSTLDPATGLARYDPRYWLFLDWTEIQREGCPAVLNLWLLLALEKMAELHALCGNTKRSRAVRGEAVRLRGALRRLLDGEGLMRDGYDSKGRPVTKTALHSQTLALMTRLNPRSARTMIERALLPFLRGETQPEARPSAYWVTYLLGVLQEYGHGEEVLAFIRRHWTPMLAHGSTWEDFRPNPGDASSSHAWSAHPLYHLIQTLGGIRQNAPGWSEILYAPVFHGASATVKIPTPKGIIHSSWVRQAGQIRASLFLPRGVSACVRLPGSRMEKITNGKTWRLPDPPPASDPSFS